MSSFGRALGVLRTGSRLVRSGQQKITTRKAGGEAYSGPLYRQRHSIPRKLKIESEILSGAMWFWILWHFWHDPDAVMGHFPWPDASQWTDEELGIPPDDEE